MRNYSKFKTFLRTHKRHFAMRPASWAKPSRGPIRRAGPPPRPRSWFEQPHGAQAIRGARNIDAFAARHLQKVGHQAVIALVVVCGDGEVGFPDKRIDARISGIVSVSDTLKGGARK